jgi:hypothetical protein
VTGRNDDIIVRALSLQSPQSRICRQPASHWAGTGSAASQGAHGAVLSRRSGQRMASLEEH